MEVPPDRPGNVLTTICSFLTSLQVLLVACLALLLSTSVLGRSLQQDSEAPSSSPSPTDVLNCESPGVLPEISFAVRPAAVLCRLQMHAFALLQRYTAVSWLGFLVRKICCLAPVTLP